MFRQDLGRSVRRESHVIHHDLQENIGPCKLARDEFENKQARFYLPLAKFAKEERHTVLHEVLWAQADLGDGLDFTVGLFLFGRLQRLC